MKQILIYPVGTTDACAYAGAYLSQAGLLLTDHPSPEVTHLLLDVPSFAPDGCLRGGGSLPEVLERLPVGVTVIGGQLKHPALAAYSVIDLLRDADYLARNAAITAESALRIGSSLLPTVLPDTPALVVGWGRIGKCLGKLLDAMGCPVTIAVRNPTDRAMIRALGGQAIEIAQIPQILPDIRLLINTVPSPILGADILDSYKGCVKLDLASQPGLDGCDIIYARGLPGQYTPKSSGSLIAETILRHLREETL